jgi:protein-disulfide isomerase
VPRSFGLTFDYLCPFARNAHEHVIAALEAGADWDVRFVPYSLSQGHLGDGETAYWDREDPDAGSGILAFQVGLAVRDHLPERFLEVHRALFAARHDDGQDIKDREVVREVLTGLSVDADEILGIVDDRRPLKVLAEEHTAGVDHHGVWGVPTFIAGGRAVFVRVMDRPEDADHARRSIEQVLDLVEGAPMLHEFKQTVLDR